MNKTVSVITSCFNEESNLREFYERLVAVLRQHDTYTYEIIIADNCSTDDSRTVLRQLAEEDKHVKVILNANNFGVVRSPYNAFMAASGDAVIAISSDLEEPPELVAQFIAHWEAGYRVVCGVKTDSTENRRMYWLRRLFYRLLALSSETEQIQNFNGFGLYDRQVVEAMRAFHEPYPFFRGLVSEVGFRRALVPFVHQRRKAGRTKNNLYALYEQAVLGFVNHTKLPLRIAVLAGFALAAVNLGVAVAYFVYKILYWNTFSLGLAPVVIGLFFFASVQLIFIGILGEYIGAIWVQVKRKPWVVEESRINFDDNVGDGS